MKTRITFMLAGVGNSHLDISARWILDFDVSRRIEGHGFNFSKLEILITAREYV